MPARRRRSQDIHEKIYDWEKEIAADTDNSQQKLAALYRMFNYDRIVKNNACTTASLQLLLTEEEMGWQEQA